MKVLRLFAALLALLLLAACAAPVESAVPEEPAEPALELDYGEVNGITWREVYLADEEYAELYAWLNRPWGMQENEVGGREMRIRDTHLLIERDAQIWMIDETESHEVLLVDAATINPAYNFAHVVDVLAGRLFLFRAGVYGNDEYGYQGFFRLHKQHRISDTQLLIERGATIWLLDEVSGEEALLLDVNAGLCIYYPHSSTHYDYSYDFAHVGTVLNERFFTYTFGLSGTCMISHTMFFDINRMTNIKIEHPEQERLTFWFVGEGTLYFLGDSRKTQVFAVPIETLGDELPIKVGESLLVDVPEANLGASVRSRTFSSDARYLVVSGHNSSALRVFDLQKRVFVGEIELEHTDISVRFWDERTLVATIWAERDNPNRPAILITLP